LLSGLVTVLLLRDVPDPHEELHGVHADQADTSQSNTEIEDNFKSIIAKINIINSLDLVIGFFLLYSDPKTIDAQISLDRDISFHCKKWV